MPNAFVGGVGRSELARTLSSGFMRLFFTTVSLVVCLMPAKTREFGWVLDSLMLLMSLEENTRFWSPYRLCSVKPRFGSRNLSTTFVSPGSWIASRFNGCIPVVWNPPTMVPIDIDSSQALLKSWQKLYSLTFCPGWVIVKLTPVGFKRPKNTLI